MVQTMIEIPKVEIYEEDFFSRLALFLSTLEVSSPSGPGYYTSEMHASQSLSIAYGW